MFWTGGKDAIEGNVRPSSLQRSNPASSPLSVNRWKWAITPFDVASRRFYRPTSLLLLDLSADFKAPPPSLSSHFNPLHQSPSVQSTLSPTQCKNLQPKLFHPSSLHWVAITTLGARWPALSLLINPTKSVHFLAFSDWQEMEEAVGWVRRVEGGGCGDACFQRRFGPDWTKQRREWERRKKGVDVKKDLHSYSRWRWRARLIRGPTWMWLNALLSRALS